MAEREPTGRPPRASVIIPCLNEEEHLGRVLDGVLAQDVPPSSFEVLVVDGGSADRSADIARSRGVRVISSPRGISRQRNLGAAETRAPVLVFLDADCVVRPDWMRRGLKLIEDGGAGMAGGPIASDEGCSWVGRAWHFHNATRWRVLGGQKDEVFRVVTTANLFVRRNVFDQVGGFDESLPSGEDFFFCYQAKQLGERVAFDAAMPVQHLGQPATLGGFFREQAWHANREVWRRLRARGQARAGQAAYRYGVASAALLLGAVAGAIVSALTFSPWPLVVAVAAYLALPVALSVRTCCRGRALRPLVALALLYLVYGLARALYLMGILRLGYRRR